MAELPDGIGTMVEGMENEFSGRKSYVELLQRSNHPKALTDRLHAVGELKTFFEDKLTNLPNPEQGKRPHMDQDGVNHFAKELNEKRAALGEYGEFEKNGRFVLDERGIDEIEKYGQAKGAFDAAERDLKAFLSGSKKFKSGDKEYAASAELQNAYKDAEKHAKGVGKLLNGWFSDLKIWGPESTLQRNLNFMDEELVANRKPQVFGRVGGVAAGGAMVVDAMFRRNAMDTDDKRGNFERIAELAAGLGIAGASAFAGAAR